MHIEEDLLIRIERLEEELDKLTDVVKAMSDQLIKVSDAAKEFIKNESN